MLRIAPLALLFLGCASIRPIEEFQPQRDDQLYPPEPTLTGQLQSLSRACASNAASSARVRLDASLGSELVWFEDYLPPIGRIWAYGRKTGELRYIREYRDSVQPAKSKGMSSEFGKRPKRIAPPKTSACESLKTLTQPKS
jgi:hypothetical protein